MKLISKSMGRVFPIDDSVMVRSIGFRDKEGKEIPGGQVEIVYLQDGKLVPVAVAKWTGDEGLKFSQEFMKLFGNALERYPEKQTFDIDFYYNLAGQSPEERKAAAEERQHDNRGGQYQSRGDGNNYGNRQQGRYQGEARGGGRQQPAGRYQPSNDFEDPYDE